MSSPLHDTPARVATVSLTESFLDELLRRVRKSERFPGAFAQRLSLPPPALGGADLELAVESTSVTLRERARGRVWIRVGMHGRIVWDMAVRKAAQNLRVGFTLGVRPEVRFDGDTMVLAADFGAAQVDDVTLEVLDTPYVPGAVPTELVGPVGRRLIDTAGREALAVFVRGLGTRTAEVRGPVGAWFGVLGAHPDGAIVHVGDGTLVVEVHDGVPARAAPVGRGGDGHDGPLHVSVEQTAAPGLLAHWAQELTAEDPNLDISDVEFAFPGSLVEMTGRVRRPVPGMGRSRPVEAEVRMRFRPACDPEYVTFEMPDVDVTWVSVRAVRPVLQRLLHRWARSRLRVPALWQFPVPLVPDKSWILGIKDVSVEGATVEVALSAWFAPE